MKSIIFLDIDGVLTTEREYGKPRRKFWDKYDEAKQLRIPYPFNSGCVKILNEILKETDAEIVLTSDWKFHFGLKELDQIFKFNKVIKSPMNITKNDLSSLSNLDVNRGNQISIYIEDHKVNNYVIIDDLNLENYTVKDKFVKTNNKEGLKQCGIKEKILKILKHEQK